MNIGSGISNSNINNSGYSNINTGYIVLPLSNCFHNMCACLVIEKEKVVFVPWHGLVPVQF
jgi:hypothetical protein